MKDCNCKDVTWLFGMKGGIISDLLKYMLAKMGAVKVQMNLRMLFKKPEPSVSTNINDKLNNGELHKYTKSKILVTTSEIPTLLREWESELDLAIDQFVQRGSGWQLGKLNQVYIQFSKYIARAGGCHTKLPKWIQNKGVTINIQTDMNCFVYSVLAALHPVRSHPERPKKYEHLFTEYDFTGIGDVVSINDISEFERNNNISINVYTLDFEAQKKSHMMPASLGYGFEIIQEVLQSEEFEQLPKCIRNIVPLKVNKEEREKHADLLLVDDHSFTIRTFNRLLAIQGDSSNKFLPFFLHLSPNLT